MCESDGNGFPYPIPGILNHKYTLSLAMFTSDVKFFQKAIVLHPSSERFLVLKRADGDLSGAGQWDFPGGSVDFGELHLPALEREIWEESGLAIHAPAIVEVITKFEPAQQIYSIFLAYQCRALSSDVCLSEEHSDYCWVTPGEWQAFDAPLSLKQIVNVYMMRRGSCQP